jgi:hypothetical protein
LNVPGINDVRETELHTAELLIPEPILSRLKLLLKIYKSPGIDQILAELMKAGKICTLTNCFLE